MINTIEVDSEIYLESLKLSMAPLIFSIIEHDRQYLKTWLPFVNQTWKQADTELFIKNVTNEVDGKNMVYSVYFNNLFAGLVSLKNIDYINKRTEIGYWLAENMQGKGIAIRSVRKLIDFAFRNLDLNRVQIRVAVENSKSAVIPKRLGFEFEGIERDGEFHTNKFLNIEVYSYLKKDWIESLRTELKG